ncbi:MAG: hypothetical protein AAB217_01540 [Chloroflexota bacterium]
MSDHDGRAASVPDAALLATNGLIHDEMLRVLREGENAPRP